MQDRIYQVDETSCNARPDHTFGSIATEPPSHARPLMSASRQKRPCRHVLAKCREGAQAVITPLPAKHRPFNDLAAHAEQSTDRSGHVTHAAVEMIRSHIDKAQQRMSLLEQRPIRGLSEQETQFINFN
jgi:hypothetical protein